MAFEYIPAVLFGLLFLVIGLRIPNTGALGMLKLGLIIGGIILIGWAIFTAWAELTAGLN